jgi:hypothetical protein
MNMNVNILKLNPIKNNSTPNIQGVKFRKFSDEEKNKIKIAADSVQGNPYHNLDRFRGRASRAIDSILDSSLKDDLNAMKNHSGSVALLIENLPISKALLAPTPQKGEMPRKEDNISEAILLGIADHIGGKMTTQEQPSATEDHISIKALQSHPIEQIIPTKEINTIPEKFEIPNFIHVEDANSFNLPDTLLLTTLRGDKNAKSIVLPVDKIVKDLDSEIINSLRKKEFLFLPEEGEGSEEITSPVIYKDDKGQDNIRFHSDPKCAIGLTEEAANALTTLRAYISDPKNVPTITLKKGDMFISDNKRALHGTYPYHNSPENDNGQRRWLQRAYLKLDDDLPIKTKK